MKPLTMGTRIGLTETIGKRVIGDTSTLEILAEACGPSKMTLDVPDLRADQRYLNTLLRHRSDILAVAPCSSFVYPGAIHVRSERSLGAMQLVTRMFRNIQRNTDFPRSIANERLVCLARISLLSWHNAPNAVETGENKILP